MNRHRLDLLSLLLGAAVIAIGIITSTDRLGALVNDRPDSLIPVASLAAGAVLVFVALRRAVSDRALEPALDPARQPTLFDAPPDQQTADHRTT